MSNLGLARFLNDWGLSLEHTTVGDGRVVERLRAGGYNLGGEQSGHIVMTDHPTTGDGLIAALQTLSAVARAGKRASALLSSFEPAPPSCGTFTFPARRRWNRMKTSARLRKRRSA